MFLWNSQNANSVDFRDFSNTVKDGEGSIGVEFIVKELPIYGFSGRTSTVVDQVKVSLVISKLDQYFDYLEQLVIEFADQKIECSYDTKRNSVVIVNEKIMSFKRERRLLCHTNSLLPTFRFVSTENVDDDSSYAAKDKMCSLLPENEMRYRNFFRLVRKKFMSKEEFRKRLVTEFETHDNWEELNNLYLYYTLNNIIDSINVYILSFTRRLSYMLPLRAFAERYYRIQNSWIEDIEPDGRNLAMYLFHLDNDNRRTRQILWGAKQMLTQKHVAKRYMIAKK